MSMKGYGRLIKGFGDLDSYNIPPAPFKGGDVMVSIHEPNNI